MSKDYAPDLFKVGYTTVSVQSRVRQLNRQARGVTAAIGRFRAVHSRSVPRSQTAERRVFDLLAQHRVWDQREFFHAPLPVIVAAVDSIADSMVVVPPRSLSAACPQCGRVQLCEVGVDVSEVELFCGPCGWAWTQDFPIDEG